MASGWGNPKMNQPTFSRKSTRRYWMPDGGNGLVVFLDGNPHITCEHQAEIGGDFKNWIVCTKAYEQEPCPVCAHCAERDLECPSAWAAFLTVCSLYTNKQGQETAVKSLFGMKQGTYKIIEDMLKARAKGGAPDATGWMVRIARIGAKSPNVGSSFDFQRHLTAAETKAEMAPLMSWIGEMTPPDKGPPLTLDNYLVPYDYKKLFKLPTPDEYRAFIATATFRKQGSRSFGGGSTRGSGQAPIDNDSDIPF